MTETTTNDLLHFEAYKGRQITIVEIPHRVGPYSARAAYFQASVDNSHVFGSSNFSTERSVREDGEWVFVPLSDDERAKVLKKAVKRARDVIDTRIADAEIRPSLEGCIAYVPRKANASLRFVGQAAEDFNVGDRVWFFSRGNLRSGKVEKVGKTNVGVAYVTEVGGIITRKSLKPGQVGFAVEEV